MKEGGGCPSSDILKSQHKAKITSAAFYSLSHTSITILLTLHLATVSLFEPGMWNPCRCRWSHRRDRFNRPLMSLWNALSWQSNKEPRVSADLETDPAPIWPESVWLTPGAGPNPGPIHSSVSCCSETCELNNASQLGYLCNEEMMRVGGVRRDLLS